MWTCSWEERKRRDSEIILDATRWTTRVRIACIHKNSRLYPRFCVIPVERFNGSRASLWSCYLKTLRSSNVTLANAGTIGYKGTRTHTHTGLRYVSRGVYVSFTVSNIALRIDQRSARILSTLFHESGAGVKRKINRYESLECILCLVDSSNFIASVNISFR